MSKEDVEAGSAHKSPSVVSTHDTDAPVVEIDGQLTIANGVKTLEATNQVYTKYSKWFLFVGLGLASYIYSLDSQTTYSYLTWAASDLENHSLISAIQVAQGIIIACGKPVIAKVADVSSRGLAYLAVLIFYVLGYVVIASAKRIETVAGGIILYAIGYTGLQLLTSIIIADITSLKWRGLVSGLVSLPFMINAFIGANVSTAVIENAGWRWGYGMFAILVPAALSPLIVTLLWGEWKAKKLGLVQAKQLHPRAQNIWKHIWSKIVRVGSELDLIGLILIGASVSCILLPLTLAEGARGQWKNPSMLAMIIIGCLLLPFVGVWDFKFAKFPAIPFRFIKNRSVVLAALIGFFDFVSFYLTYTYLFSFIIVVKPWTLLNATYFIYTQSVALTFFGICAGIYMRFARRYKYMLITGLCIRLLGVGLMLHSRGADGSDAEVVWCQLLQGMGGGMASVSTSVASQASVPHVDVAMVTAFVLLIVEIGGSIGSAIAGSVWTKYMPQKLAEYLPDAIADQTVRDSLYSSITTVVTYPRGDPIREGVINAYRDVMWIQVLIGLVFSIPPILFAFGMPNWYLGDKQNAVEDVEEENTQYQRSGN